MGERETNRSNKESVRSTQGLESRRSNRRGDGPYDKEVYRHLKWGTVENLETSFRWRRTPVGSWGRKFVVSEVRDRE